MFVGTLLVFDCYFRHSFWQESVESSNAFTLAHCWRTWSAFTFCSFLWLRKEVQNVKLHWSLSLALHPLRLTFICSYLQLSFGVLWDISWCFVCSKSLGSLRRKVMLRSERSVKPTAMFRTQCGSCVLSTPAAAVWAAPCPHHCNWYAGSYRHFKKIWLFFVCVVCVCQCEFICTVCVQEPVEAKRGCWIPGSWGTGSCEPPSGCGNSAGPLQKAWGHWSTEPSPAPSTLSSSFLPPTFTSPSTHKEPESSCFVLMIKTVVDTGRVCVYLYFPRCIPC